MIDKNQAFELLEKLARELTAKEVDLPALPSVVLRLREELGNDAFDVDAIARVIAAEPSLAGAVLSMGNSYLHRRIGKETLDLKVAIPRIGQVKLQALSLRFAVQQMKEVTSHPLVGGFLAAEWSMGRDVAAAAFLLARQTRAAHPDEAVVVGLLHNIGRIYLYSRAADHPELFADPTGLRELVDGWQANVGYAIAEAWQLPNDAITAFAVQAGVERPANHALAHILMLAINLADKTEDDAPERLMSMARHPSAIQLQLSVADLATLQGEVEETRISLGLVD
ncbi:HDOD domain-containing protein [Thioalkalivibrio sp. XN279]|uniref:HDOD domain-containing protein n=1 Tax=Thioalkalivibrio sp. XN279 TaxID=2714953 RepID=UPI00140E783D|nr:HDOD domain-containing protein [Thioalkalivibrio sp. XN279]NHA13787.1 HDOD domain-containing protein [Thioalkalivibrio sp. XN279]